MSELLRDSISASFARHRKAPNAPFDSLCFLNFLTEPPSERGSSFGGNRRYHAFVREIQMQHGVMLSQKDHERSYSLGQLAERVAHLQANPRASLQSLRNAKRHSDIALIVFGNAILFGLGAWSIDAPALFWSVVATAILFNALIIGFGISERIYLSKLEKRIENG